jgi:hypothetical protein
VSLIDELYDQKDLKWIRQIYSEDPNSRELLYKSFGNKIIEKQDTFLNSKPLDILCLICMTAPFAEDKEECHTVGIIIHKGLKYENPLPYVLDDQGFLLAEKTLVALSFFRSAMDYRAKYKGAPTSNFYRNASKLLFSKNGHDNIADHHEQWENFLCEIFI